MTSERAELVEQLRDRAGHARREGSCTAQCDARMFDKAADFIESQAVAGLYTTPQPAPVDAEIATPAPLVSLDCREWFYHPIEMPITKDGKGPATYRDADRVVYEVWDQLLISHSSHKYLCDAINEAMRLESIRNALAAQQQESKS